MSSSARIDELRRKFDENPRRYFAPLANEYRKAGDFEQAIFICQEYLPQQPGHMSGHIVFGQALFEAKRLPEARTVFETALSLDPENLIALRHLADISRDLGETAAARTWYERVLQADPRNEEIAAIVAALPAAGTAPTPTVEETAPMIPAGLTPEAIQQASAPTVELSAAAVQEMMKARIASRPEPIHEPLTIDTAPTVEISAQHEAEPMAGLESNSAAPAMDLPSVSELGLESNSVAEPSARAPDPLGGLDVMSLDDFSLPSSSPTAKAEVPAAAASMEPAIEQESGGLLDFDSFSIGGEPAAAAPPAPISAAPPNDTAAESGDGMLTFELPSSPAPAAKAEPVVAAPPSEEAIPTLVMEAVKAPAAPTPSVEIPAVVMDETPTRNERPAPAFVNETMAKLYLEQGHRAEAIDIYRQLVAARPNDDELRARLDAIEQSTKAATPVAAPAYELSEVSSEMRPRSATPAAPAAPAPPAVVAPSAPAARFVDGGPSIRSVLRGLFGLDGSAAPMESRVVSEVGSIDILFSSDSVADPLDPLAVAFDGGFVATSGSIDSFFASNA